MWEDYLKHFQGVALWNRWDNDDKAEGLYLALDRVAANYVYSQPHCEECTFEKLCTMLEIRFGADQTIALDRKKLKERKRERGETYADLGQDILRLAHRVYKTAPEMAEREARDYFICALSPQLKMDVAARDPVTVNQCVGIMCVMLDLDEDLQEFKKVRRIDKPPPKKGSGTNVYSKASGNAKNPDDKDKNVWCWDCGKVGLRRNQCPEHFKYKPKGKNGNWKKPAPDSEQSDVKTQNQDEVNSTPKDGGSQ